MNRHLFTLLALITLAPCSLFSSRAPAPNLPVCKLSIDQFLSQIIASKPKPVITTPIEHQNFCVANYNGAQPKLEHYLTIHNFNRAKNVFHNEGAFFGLYDGTGDDKVAKLASAMLHTSIFDHIEFDANPAHAIEQAFNDFDKDLSLLSKNNPIADNARASVALALVRNKELYLAWLGDARIVAATHDSYVASTDHTPGSAAEVQRLKKYGAEIRANLIKFPQKINGSVVHRYLPVSRALGAQLFQSGGLSATPDISMLPLHSSEYPFVILANRGIWDTISNGLAYAIVKEALETHRSCVAAASILVDTAVLLAAKRNNVENMTALVVNLKNLAFEPTTPPKYLSILSDAAEKELASKDEESASVGSDDSQKGLVESSSSDGDTFMSATTPSEVGPD